MMLEVGVDALAPDSVVEDVTDRGPRSFSEDRL